MSNSDYRVTFQAIKEVKESNIAFMNKVIELVTKFTEKIDRIMEKIGQVSNELPTKKQKKKGAALMAFFRDDSADDKYEVLDPEFTPTWNLITSGFVNKPHGMSELNNLFKEFFIEKLKVVIKSYTESYAFIEMTIKNALDSFDPVRNRYSKAIQDYNSLISRIEQLNEKLKPENTNGKNPDVIEKLRTQLTDAKADLPAAEIEASEATQAFNEANLNFSITCEKMMSQFENYDQEHEKQVREVFVEFFNKFPVINDIYKEAETEIPKLADPTKVIPQPPMFEDNQKEIKVTPNFPIPSFDISNYCDPSEIFKTELEQKMAIVTSSNVHSFPQGSLVVVTSENPKDNTITIADVINMKSNVVQKSDIKYAEQKRSLAQLKENYTVQSDNNNFEWHAKEVLLVTPHNLLKDQNVWCTDMYGRSGEVPFNKLNTK